MARTATPATATSATWPLKGPLSATRSPADPFLQRVRLPQRAMFNVLGVPVQFESNAGWLLGLAGQAYDGLPACEQAPSQLSAHGQHLRVRLLANDDAQPHIGLTEAPVANVYASDDVVSAIFSPSDAVVCALTSGSALIIVSPVMRAFPYHVRYEMIEFACYRLVSHHVRAVGLHAACIARGDKAWLIFGETGAGKSTLTFACLQHGWELIAEDSAFVLPQAGGGAEVRGVPAFVHLLDDMLGLFPKHALMASSITRRSGAVKHEIDVRATFKRPMRVCAPLAGCVFLTARRQQVTPAVRRLTPEAAQRQLVRSQPFAPNYPRWPDVVALIRRLPAVALSCGTDLARTVEVLGRL